MKFTNLFILIILSLILQNTYSQLRENQQGFASNSKNYVIRLRPGQDLMTTLLQYAKINQFKAASISMCVGSVVKCGLRLSGHNFLTEISQQNETFEILSLTGTIDSEGNPHMHISLSDIKGNTIGGHLPSLKERKQYQQEDFSCPVFTTAEIVITEHLDLTFTREIDPETTYDELIITPNTKSDL